jgi:hypothetical protein
MCMYFSLSNREKETFLQETLTCLKDPLMNLKGKGDEVDKKVYVFLYYFFNIVSLKLVILHNSFENPLNL